MRLRTIMVTGVITLLLFVGCRTKQVEETTTSTPETSPVEEAVPDEEKEEPEEVEEPTPTDEATPAKKDEPKKDEPKTATEAQQTDTGTQPTSEEPKTDTSAQESEKKTFVRTFTVTAKRFQFDISPSPFRALVGDEVVLTLTSEDVPHGFKIPEYGINIQLNPGETKTTSFTADKKGKFTVSCSVYCGVGHFEMKNVFTVE